MNDRNTQADIADLCCKAGFPELGPELLLAGASIEDAQRRIDRAKSLASMKAEVARAGLAPKSQAQIVGEAHAHGDAYRARRTGEAVAASMTASTPRAGADLGSRAGSLANMRALVQAAGMVPLK